MRVVALLRAVNVGGRGRLPMSDLRALVTGAGFRDVATVLQTGNVIVEPGKRAPGAVRDAIAAALATAGHVTDVVVRTADDMDEVVAQNPFPEHARSDPAHLTVSFLGEAPSGAAVAALRAKIVGRETVELRGCELYAYYPDGIGDSKLTAAVIERALAVRGTARNWNTVLKLVEALART